MEQQFNHYPSYNDYPHQGQYVQAPVSSDEIYANQMNEDKIRNIISQISPENQLVDIEMRLRGYKKNVFTGDWEKISEKFKEPPEEMISRYISWLGSSMNFNTTLGNLSGTQITAIMRQAVEWVVDDLSNHAEEYGMLQDYSERDRIGDILLRSLFLVLNRSRDGQEARRFWSSLSMAESSSYNPSSHNSSGDWWKFWKK